MYLCYSTLGFAHSAGRDELIMHKIQEVIIFALVDKIRKVIYIYFYIHQENAYLIAMR